MIFLLTKVITASIKKVGKVARRIAGGEYSERIRTKGKDEIGELASDFNLMAEQVERKDCRIVRCGKAERRFYSEFCA